MSVTKSAENWQIRHIGDIVSVAGHSTVGQNYKSVGIPTLFFRPTEKKCRYDMCQVSGVVQSGGRLSKSAHL